MGIPHRTGTTALLPSYGLVAAPASFVAVSTSVGFTALTESDVPMMRETDGRHGLLTLE